MVINKLLTPFNYTDASRTKNEINGIVMHYVGALGGAEDNCRYYASCYVGASATYYVGFVGEVWQSVLDEDIAWHCGASSYVHPFLRNSNTIGIELCVRKSNTSSMGATDKDWYFEEATVVSAIKLVQMLMKKYDIPISNVIRHYDVTGKICPNPYVYNNTKHKWSSFIESAKNGSYSEPTTPEKPDNGLTPVMGRHTANANQMNAYLKSVNPNAPTLGKLFIKEGKLEGVRGDIAFAQSCLETGNFTFRDSAVTLDQNNFCGMGVTQNGMKGNSFSTPQIGIRAQIQHLKAYSSKNGLKEECVDPRFQYVNRGCAEYVEWLGIQENPQGKGWAAGSNYGKKILNILNLILKQPGGTETPDTPTPEVEIKYYVRKTFEDAKTQKGAFNILANAENCCDKNPGYHVFNSSGKSLYPTSPDKPQDSGKLVPKSGFITCKVDGVRVHSTPEWGTKNVTEHINADGKYYTVIGEILVDGKKMYKLKSGSYVDARKRFVKYTVEAPEPEQKSLGYTTGDYLLTSTMKVRSGHSTDSRQLSKNELTSDGRNHSDSSGCLYSGTRVTALEIWQTGEEGWLRSPSGWICIQKSNTKYARKV